MKVIEKPVSELAEYENNPRYNDNAVDAVANSIRDFGFKVPIIIDSGDVIVAGHTRVKAARKLGIGTVPCVVADDLTPDQVRAFRLADNKTAEIATWDAELLNAELEDLDFDMSSFGFEMAEDVPDIDDFEEREGASDKKMCQCPKCGFEWCEK